MLCPKCSKGISLEYNQTKCPHCGAEIVSGVTGPTGESIPVSAGLNAPETCPCSSSSQEPLWDNEGPFFTRLFNTWKKATFHPATFFKAIPTDAGLVKPLFYAIIIGFVASAIGVSWSLLFTALHVPILGMDAKTLEAIPFLNTFWKYILLGSVILSPLLVTIGLFIWSGILHLCLMIFGGNKKGFEATFRSVAYGYSPMLFVLIPACGTYIAAIWAIVTTIIGLKHTHQIPTWKAILAYLLPLILCICLAAIVGLLAGILIPLTMAGRPH
jgi:hypothetical protein